MSYTNNRIFYAIQSAGIAPLGSNTYTNIHGLQSIGISTKFNLQQVFEIGQLEIYYNLEEIPDVEVTAEKVLDGYPLIYHLATYPSTSATLIGRSTTKVSLGLSIFSDTSSSASGTPQAQCIASGLFVSSLSYNIPVNGTMTESVTLVGNNKFWNSSFTPTAFVNTDAPVYESGVLRRQDIVFGSGAAGTVSILPTEIPGLTGGYNMLDTTGNYAAKLQSIKLSCNLGRAPLYELGQRSVYFRYAEFPVQVSSDFESLSLAGDQVQAIENSINTADRSIFIMLNDGTNFNLGTKNRLTSVTYGGADASSQGSNATQTFSYLTFNDFTDRKSVV